MELKITHMHRQKLTETSKPSMVFLVLKIPNAEDENLGFSFVYVIYLIIYHFIL